MTPRVFAAEPAPGRWFVVLDAARSPRVLATLARSGARHASLYDGWKARELAEVAPYLVALDDGSPLWDALLGDAWGDAWGVWVRSDAGFDDLRRHLRRFLRVQGEDGRRMLFRWYDPRVLRVYLPTCTDAERRAFLGPVAAYVVEAEAPRRALRFTAERADPAAAALDEV
ncbi:MAG: DUF4123 domain-containing protein [Polyangiales bacterium]